MQILRKKFVMLMMGIFVFQAVGSWSAMAAELGDVVINEVAWAGTVDNSNDEWIELYNTSNAAVDLSGWMIVDDGSSQYKVLSGEIPAHGYFVIEDVEETISTRKADALIGLSLANAGDSLVLKDSTGKTIDEVNTNGGAWYAGDATSKGSMERIDPANSGNDATNWGTALSGNGQKSRNALEILGTPGSVNSNFGGEGFEVFINPGEVTSMPGSEVQVEINVDGANDLYAYGFEINYPAEILTFKSAEEGQFLTVDGVDTAFSFGLKNGQPGTILVGNARLVNPTNGIDGSGVLFKLKFIVNGTNGETGNITFGGSSFMADSAGDVLAKFENGSVKVVELEEINASLKNLQIAEGENRYSLKLSWESELGAASSYVIKKKLPNGEFVKISEQENSTFVDGDDVVDGGKIVPGVEYIYQVFAVNNNVVSQPFEIRGSEGRGIKGDNDRNDTVDGRDIERLARSYGSEFGDEEYDPLKDLNFDGVIDGADLIDIGVNFGLIYQN